MDVCGLDYPFTMLRPDRSLGAARLVSTPSATLSRCGLARDRHVTGFPEFEQFCIAGFPVSTQFSLSPLRLPIPPRPRYRSGYRSSRAPRQGFSAGFQTHDVDWRSVEHCVAIAGQNFLIISVFVREFFCDSMDASDVSTPMIRVTAECAKVRAPPLSLPLRRSRSRVQVRS
ncbi:hypothetical protein BH09PSE3_BH09PSE3_16410 [soil metagenome]